MDEKWGSYAFLLGVLIAIVTAFVTATWVPALLVLLGLIVGFLNISDKEVNLFLIATVALIVAGSVSTSVGAIWAPLETILQNIMILVAPAAIVVALKAIYSLASK
ncbi:MAG: hypothetical protein J7K31_02810 [Candidatus Aenigmarchaeota archaeon]|nr:hypothetical protein [Candidatus Aenigmarchaeota archaeon]RLF28872.1 MAG: hypothetical protein DRN05_02955 [Thermoplasmata archaeon]